MVHKPSVQMYFSHVSYLSALALHHTFSILYINFTSEWMEAGGCLKAPMRAVYISHCWWSSDCVALLQSSNSRRERAHVCDEHSWGEFWKRRQTDCNGWWMNGFSETGLKDGFTETSLRSNSKLFSETAEASALFLLLLQFTSGALTQMETNISVSSFCCLWPTRVFSSLNQWWWSAAVTAGGGD